MPSVARLRGRRAFADLSQSGRTVRSGPLRIRFLAAPGIGVAGARVGFAIGKRTGGAVDRNRIRRRLRAAVASTKVPLNSGYYVISADSSALRTPFPALVSAVENAVEKLQP